MGTLREGAPTSPSSNGKLIRLPGTIGRFQFVCTAEVRAPGRAALRVLPKTGTYS